MKSNEKVPAGIEMIRELCKTLCHPIEERSEKEKLQISFCLLPFIKILSVIKLDTVSADWLIPHRSAIRNVIFHRISKASKAI